MGIHKVTKEKYREDGEYFGLYLTIWDELVNTTKTCCPQMKETQLKEDNVTL